MGLITDPSTGLLDRVDYILLAGVTGLHERFGRLYTLVNGNVDKDNMKISSDFPWTGNHTYEAGKLKVKGAGAGIASIQNANTANNRLITIPDPGADADFVTTKGNQTIDDTKTFSQNLTFKSGTAFNGIFDHANTADRTWVAPDASGNILISAAQQTVDGRKTFSGADTLLLPTDAPTVNRSAGLVSNVLQIHDGTSAKSYLRTDTYAEATLTTDVNLGNANDVAFVDADPNAKITFTVNVPGRYLVNFNFRNNIGSTGGGGVIIYDCSFRLTDGTTNMMPVSHSGAEQTTFVGDFYSDQLNITNVFYFTTTGAKTVKLQKKNSSFTGVNSNWIFKDSIGGTNISISMSAHRIAD